MWALLALVVGLGHEILSLNATMEAQQQCFQVGLEACRACEGNKPAKLLPTYESKHEDGRGSLASVSGANVQIHVGCESRQEQAIVL